MEPEHHYNVDLTWNEKRIGELSSPELPVKIQVATPPEFDQGIAGVWSPEHLYVAAISSCLMTTFLAIADYSKFEYLGFSCAADGTLTKEDGKFKITEVLLKPVVTIPKGGDEAKALRLVQKAEAACLITNSVTTQVHLEVTVKLADV